MPLLCSPKHYVGKGKNLDSPVFYSLCGWLDLSFRNSNIIIPFLVVVLVPLRYVQVLVALEVSGQSMSPDLLSHDQISYIRSLWLWSVWIPPPTCCTKPIDTSYSYVNMFKSMSNFVSFPKLFKLSKWVPVIVPNQHLCFP